MIRSPAQQKLGQLSISRGLLQVSLTCCYLEFDISDIRWRSISAYSEDDLASAYRLMLFHFFEITKEA